MGPSGTGKTDIFFGLEPEEPERAAFDTNCGGTGVRNLLRTACLRVIWCISRALG